jgi:hypothetical protein
MRKNFTIIATRQQGGRGGGEVEEERSGICLEVEREAERKGSWMMESPLHVGVLPELAKWLRRWAQLCLIPTPERR